MPRYFVGRPRQWWSKSGLVMAICIAAALSPKALADDTQEVVVVANRDNGSAIVEFPLQNLIITVTVTHYATGHQSSNSKQYDPTSNPNCQNKAKSPSASNLIHGEEGIGPSGLNGGYVPGHGSGAGSYSGVTIYYGVDLARQSYDDLSNAGVSLVGLAKVSPFLKTKMPWTYWYPGGRVVHTWRWDLGPTGTDAQAALTNAGGLTLSSADSAAAGAMAVNNAISTVENQITPDTYEQMPEILQDVLADVSFHRGSLSTDMVEEISDDDWAALVASIFQDPNMDPTRRQRDANILAQAIMDGAAPGDGSSTC